LSSSDYSGIVSLLRWDVTHAVWFTFCTGVLLTNTKVVTARHCFAMSPGIPDSERIIVKMGSQQQDVLVRVPHPNCDVEVLKMFPMVIWNWHYDHFLTSPGQLKNFGYARPIYGGTNASLNGTGLLCFGYGGATVSNPQPALTYAGFYATYPTNIFGPPACGAMYLVLNGVNPSGATTVNGDSGGPCLTNLSSFASPVASILSNDFNGQFGAENWRDWVNAQ